MNDDYMMINDVNDHNEIKKKKMHWFATRYEFKHPCKASKRLRTCWLEEQLSSTGVMKAQLCSSRLLQDHHWSFGSSINEDGQKSCGVAMISWYSPISMIQPSTLLLFRSKSGHPNLEDVPLLFTWRSACSSNWSFWKPADSKWTFRRRPPNGSPLVSAPVSLAWCSKVWVACWRARLCPCPSAGSEKKRLPLQSDVKIAVRIIPHPRSSHVIRDLCPQNPAPSTYPISIWCICLYWCILFMYIHIRRLQPRSVSAHLWVMELHTLLTATGAVSCQSLDSNPQLGMIWQR